VILTVAWEQGGAIGLVVLVVLLVLTGKLVPRSVVIDIRRDRDDRVAEAKAETRIWREAFELARRSNEALIPYMHQLIEVGHTTNSVLQALPASQSSGEDGTNATAST
jgi:hypothetical protein